MFPDGRKITRRSIATEGRVIEMEKTLSELFQENHGAPVRVSEMEVVPIFRIGLDHGWNSFLLELKDTDVEFQQGVRLSIKGGEIEVDGISSPDVVIWNELAPPAVAVRVFSKKKENVLSVWNTWRFKRIDQAWIGNSGMVVSADDRGYLFSCSNGVGDVDFSDFVFMLRKR